MEHHRYFNHEIVLELVTYVEFAWPGYALPAPALAGLPSPGLVALPDDRAHLSWRSKPLQQNLIYLAKFKSFAGAQPDAHM